MPPCNILYINWSKIQNSTICISIFPLKILCQEGKDNGNERPFQSTQRSYQRVHAITSFFILSTLLSVGSAKHFIRSWLHGYGYTGVWDWKCGSHKKQQHLYWLCTMTSTACILFLHQIERIHSEVHFMINPRGTGFCLFSGSPKFLPFLQKSSDI